VSFNGAAGIPDLNRSQSDLGRELDRGFDPELRFSVWVGNVNMLKVPSRSTVGDITKLYTVAQRPCARMA
jgi:hypothetical protein